MNLSSFKAAIDATIGGLTGKVTKARHKSANDTIAEAFFTPLYEETETGGTKTTLIKSGLSYNVTLNKMGNKVFIKGDLLIGTSTGTGSGDIDLFQLNDTELQQKTGKSYYIDSFGFGGSPAPTTLLKIANGKMILTNGFVLQAGVRYGFSDFYFTND